MADLDKLISDTADDLVTMAIENGYLHSGVDGSGFVDLPVAESSDRADEIYRLVRFNLAGSRLVAEVERLRADRAAIVDWIVGGFGWPLDVSLAADSFPGSWRQDVVDAWERHGAGEGITREELAEFIAQEANWIDNNDKAEQDK